MALRSNQTTGIILLVLGLLAVLGAFNGIVVLVAGIAALVYGILVVMGKQRNATWVGILCIVIGVLLLIGKAGVLGSLLGILVWVAGVVLIVVGILKLIGKA